MNRARDRKLIFCRIGWMTEYKGIGGDPIRGGGVFVDEQHWGGEIFNFLQTDKNAYGYVQPPPIYGDAEINLDRIDNSTVGNELYGVTVIWFANRPGVGQVIIGWYGSATAYRNVQNPSSERKAEIRDKLPANASEWLGEYYFKAVNEEVTLLPVCDRRFQVPRQRFFSGQSNVWYADSDEREVRKYVSDVFHYIEHYSSGYKPKSQYFIEGTLPEIQEKAISMGKKQLDKLSSLEDSLKGDPDNFNLLKEISEILVDGENYNKALQYLNRALILNGQDWELHHWMAKCEEGTLNLEKALEYMAKALPLAPANVDKALLHNDIGCIHDELADYPSALNDFTKAVELNDSEPLYHRNEGIIYYQMEQYEKAIPHLLKANEIKPNEEETLNWLGFVYEESNDYSNAIHYYSLAISCDTNDTYAIENLAKLYENLGMFSKARSTWQLLRRGDRILKKAEKALRRLAGKADKPTIIIESRILEPESNAGREVSLDESTKKVSNLTSKQVDKLLPAEANSTLIDFGVDGDDVFIVNKSKNSNDMLEATKISKFQVGDRIKCDFDEGEAIGTVVSLDGVEDGVVFGTIIFDDGNTESVYLDETVTKLTQDLDEVPSLDVSKEKYLEEEICRLIKYGLVFNGELEIYRQPGEPYGQQYPTDVGRIDLLCRNKKTNSLVVIEIKRGKSADQVIGQISRYMGYVKKKIAKPGQSIEGIIVTYGPDKKLEYAVAIHDKIRVFTYSVNISEWHDEE